MDYSSILTTTLLLLLTSCAQLRVSSVMGEAAGQSAPQLSKEVASKLIVAPSSPKTEEMAPPPSHVKLGKARVEQARISGQKSPNYHIIGSAKIRQSGKHQHKTYFLYGAEHLKLNNYYFDFPVVYNAAVKKWIDYFLTRGRGFFERYGSRAGRYAPLMGEILESRGLPRDLIFLAMAESGFQTHAKSWAKAVGPWQFMPYTGKRFGLKIDWYIDQRRDPIRSTIAAANYLTKLYGDFEAWELAAAAYNAGEGKIRRAIRRYRTESFWKLRKGRYLRSETKNYVPKIMALAIIGKNLAAFGMENLEFRQPLDFEEISVGPNVDLVNLAQALKVSFKELQRLNPEILRWFTPPNVEEYILRVPLGIATQWEECCKAVDLTAKAFQKYKVRGRRSTIRDVA
ncbi:MAG: lytic transglycosylase domain-containing protein, partial [Bdellovibrionales bacterium]|nr:lytic transglycosylase domain-containing protein [Bdellovibrionales bacterium]